MKPFIRLICAAFLIVLTLAGSTALAQNKPPLSAGQAIVEAIRIKPPLSFCGETVPLSDPEIRERLERELLVSLDNSDDIILWLKRANRYFPYIEKVLREQGLPDDLKYITIAESSLRPLAFSNKGASGYWQFIESTGTKYGLDISNDIDERRNVYRATQAALRYLRELFALFGSWTLAAAAYNMGEDGLKSEILVQQENNYYRLYLNQETQRYVFRILAAKIIMSNPARFGYVLLPDDLYRPRNFETVEIKVAQPAPLYLLARAANTTFKTVKDLNPQIKYYHLPSGAHRLAVPPGSSAGFAERLEKLLAEWLKTRNDFVYTVKKGDTLTGIAARFNVPYRALLIWNRLGRGNRIVAGDKLYIFSNDFKTGYLSSPAGGPAPPEPPVPEFDPVDPGP